MLENNLQRELYSDLLVHNAGRRGEELCLPYKALRKAFVVVLFVLAKFKCPLTTHWQMHTAEKPSSEKKGNVANACSGRGSVTNNCAK